MAQAGWGSFDGVLCKWPICAFLTGRCQLVEGLPLISPLRPGNLQVVGSACKCLCTIASKSAAAAPKLAELAAVYYSLLQQPANGQAGFAARFLFTLSHLCRWAGKGGRARGWGQALWASAATAW